MPHAELDVLPINMDATTKLQHDDAGAFSDSSVSDLSVLENETDEFGKRILEYQREQLRARRRATTRTLWRDRNGAERQPASYNNDKPRNARKSFPETQLLHGHGVRYEATPPVNVPKGWARKERSRTDWHRKKSILDRTATEKRIPLFEAAPTSRAPFLSTNLVDQDDTPSKRRPSTSSSMNHMNTTIHADADTGDHDFSSMSLLTSTPAVNNRDRRIDRLARAEIGRLEQRSSTGQAIPAVNGDNVAVPRRRRSLYGDWQKTETLTRTSVAPTDGAVNLNAQPVTLTNEHRRTASHTLLKQLARASLSPSPIPDLKTRDMLAATGASSTVNTEEGVANGSQEKTTTQNRSLRERLPVADEDIFGEPRSHNKGVSKTTPSEPIQPTSALADIIAESRLQGDGAFGDATLNSLNDILDAEPTKDDILAKLEATNAPKHILRVVNGTDVETAGLRKDNKHNIQHDDADHAVIKKESTVPRTTDRRASFFLRQSNAKRHDKASTISAGAIWAMLKNRPTREARATVSVRKCQDCASHGNSHSVWRSLWTELVECFCESDSKWSLGFRPTLLGTLCLAALLWFMTEISLCQQFCQPRYAPHMMGYGVNPDAPEFPYVIPTLLFRPFRWFWRPLWSVAGWILRMTAAEQPTRASSPSEEPYLVSLTKAASTTAVRSVGAAAEWGRLWDEDLWRGNRR